MKIIVSDKHASLLSWGTKLQDRKASKNSPRACTITLFTAVTLRAYHCKVALTLVIFATKLDPVSREGSKNLFTAVSLNVYYCKVALTLVLYLRQS
jgi:hypothetical protein